MHYVYFLKSLKKPDEPYIGETNNLERRFKEHNSGLDRNSHTYKFFPWELVSYVLTDTRDTGIIIESFFKSRSGQEKFENYAKKNPSSQNPINDYFKSLSIGKGFGKTANGTRFKVIQNDEVTMFAPVKPK